MYDESGKVDSNGHGHLDDIVLVFDDAGSLTTRYLHGPGIDNPFSAESLDEIFGDPVVDELVWLLTDHQGSVRDTVSYDAGNDATTVENHIQYDAFGNITGETDSTATPLYAYTGREWDEDAQLYYYRKRWYDAGVGQFVSDDPIGFAAGDANVRRYVGNSPGISTDPSGLELPVQYMCPDPNFGPPVLEDPWKLYADRVIDARARQITDFVEGEGALPKPEATDDRLRYEGCTRCHALNNFGRHIGPGWSPMIDQEGYVKPEYEEGAKRFDRGSKMALCATVALYGGVWSIHTFGAKAVMYFVVEEAAEATFESATGIPVIVDPADIAEHLIKRGVKKRAASAAQNAVQEQLKQQAERQVRQAKNVPTSQLPSQRQLSPLQQAKAPKGRPLKGNELGQGADGVVYEIPNDPNNVLKEFHHPTLPQARNEFANLENARAIRPD